MSRGRIAKAEGSAAILLPQELLDQAGLKFGDEVAVSVADGTLTIRPLDEAERAQRIKAATEEVLERRLSAYEELAGGIE